MQQSQNSVTYNLFIEGKVQGVGFRRFAKRRADELGLTGWTRNRVDGQVEVCVTGDESQIQQFMKRLKQVPPPGQVSKLNSQSVLPEVFAEFTIKPDA